MNTFFTPDFTQTLATAKKSRYSFIDAMWQKSFSCLASVLIVAILMMALPQAAKSQSTISQWTYEPLQGTTANPTPNTGAGTSALVGSMTGTGTATGMLLAGPGCGAQSGANPGAWAIATANPGAANESSGAQFNVSTIGYTGITVSWDQRWSNTSANTIRFQYTTDGSTWNNFPMTAGNTTLCAGVIDNGRFETNAGDLYRRVRIDLSSIPAVNNNSNFAFRVVAAHYQGTGQFRQANTPATVATAGTWRFDNVTVSGTVVAANPSVNLSVNSNTGTEAAATVITVTATASSAVSGSQTINLGVSGVNITAGDYTLSNATITIPDGGNTGTATFTVVDDAESEPTETAVLTITNPSSGITLGATTIQNIDITDNDVPVTTVSLSVNANTGTEENATLISVTATASAPVTGNQTVTLGVSGTGITAFDYILSGTTITILNGATSGTVTFKINNDAETEGTETATLTISNPSSGISLGTTTTQNITITDNTCQPLIRKSTIASTNGAEISAFDPSTNRIFTVAGPAMEYYSLSNAGALSGPSAMAFGFTSPGNNILPNSVAIRNGIVAVGYAVVNAVSNAQQTGVVAFYQASSATYLNHVSVGYLPDMIAFTPDGTKVLTANEGEPNSYGQANSFDPEGSVSIIDINAGVGSATVQTVSFAGFNTQIASLKAAGVRIFGPGATVAKDLEPEYIAFSADGTKAFVTLQEANAVAEINIATATATQILPLGLKNHNLAGNGLDASDRDVNGTAGGGGKINIQNWPIKGMYMPDAISSFSVGGTTYYITANEGDSRAYTGYSEEIRVGDAAYALDPAVFPNAATLKLSQNLGRLQLTNATGDTDGDGDFDEIHAFGARSFTIWNSSFSKVFDSGDQLEQITAAQNPANFNSDGATTNSFDSRSDNKGPEPEAVTTGMVNGLLYAFVGSERTGDIFVYDISNPAAPVFKQYIDNPADLGVEGLIFVPANESPTGKALVIASAEVSRTVTVYEFSPCAGKTIPGRIEAESFDAKQGLQFSTATTDAGGGQHVAGITTGSWLDYNVVVKQAGIYTVNFRVATTQDNAQFQVKLGNTVLGIINIPNTGGWDTWVSVPLTNIALTAGPKTIRIQSTGTETCNFNWMQWTIVSANTAPTVNAGTNQVVTAPVSQITLTGSAVANNGGSIINHIWTKFSGGSANITDAGAYTTSVTGLSVGTYVFRLTVTQDDLQVATSDVTIIVNPATGKFIPGRIEAESFDTKQGPQFATTTTDAGGGQHIAGLTSGNWLDYNVTVTQTGAYNISFRIATLQNNAQLQVKLGATVLATVNIPNTGGWDTWMSVPVNNIPLTAGAQTIRIQLNSSETCNFNWMDWILAGPNTAPSANAGPNQNITLPTSQVTLAGSGTANNGGSIVSQLWTKISGGSASITDPTNYGTTVTGLSAGTYIFRLTVNQNDGQSVTSEVTITVSGVVSNEKIIAGKIEAESWDAKLGIQYAIPTNDAGGGRQVVGLANGSWLDYNVTVTQTGNYTVNFRIATTQNNAQLQVKQGGAVLGTINIPNTGGWDIWQTVAVNNIALIAGVQTIRIQLSSNESCNFNWMDWILPTPTITRTSITEEKPLIADIALSAPLLKIFPNPVTDQFVLQTNSEYEGIMKIQVIDQAGNSIRQVQAVKTRGTSRVNLSAAGIPAGIYSIRVQTGSRVSTVKMIKL